jgi:UPF0755 protein
MAYYYAGRKLQLLPRRLKWLLGGLLVVLLVGAVLARQSYDSGLKAVSNSQKTQIFTVEKGSSVKQIYGVLEDEKLIRSAWIFQIYVSRQRLSNKLQAGTYALSPSQGVPEIVATMTRGKVATRLVTILPGRRIDQVRADLINDGFTPESVDKALDSNQYADLPILAIKPADVNSLEGLLWPDSYQKEPDTDPSVIIRQSLTAMSEHLTADVQAGFARQGLTPYKGLILASIVIQEVNTAGDQAQAAQVFLSRLAAGSVLGSDVTARYGSIAAGHAPSIFYDSAYNTHKHAGLPPTPISTINSTSLAAVVQPAATDWLYFVAGDNGKTYFSHTLEEHEALTAQHCHKLCGS